MENQHTTSVLLICAGALMTVSGILMAVCNSIACGGIMWAAAFCMFFAAYNFRLTENKMCETDETDETDDEYDHLF